MCFFIYFYLYSIYLLAYAASIKSFPQFFTKNCGIQRQSHGRFSQKAESLTDGSQPQKVLEGSSKKNVGSELEGFSIN